MIEQDVNMEMNWSAHWSLVVNDIISNVSPETTTQASPSTMAHKAGSGSTWTALSVH